MFKRTNPRSSRQEKAGFVFFSARAWASKLEKPVSAAPLAVFRIVFGAMMAFSTLRFMAYGWIEDHYILPKLHFHYFGFSWISPLPPLGMYGVHILMVSAALGIMMGAFYRLSAVLFFIAFTYTELIEVSYYLNHYYFVSLVSFLLIWVPAHRFFSWDAHQNPRLFSATVPQWSILIFQFQLSLVYVYAGLAKINYDWLVLALPLKIWLPAQDQLPIIGPWLRYPETAYLFSWAGMLYDTFILLFLFWRPTRQLAYGAVVVFHALTGLLFPIGVFPLVMIGSTLIFFSASFHQKILFQLAILFRWKLPAGPGQLERQKQPRKAPKMRRKIGAMALAFYVIFQLIFPWRYLLYPGNLFWTEEGYRFSWRVMLVEKAGTATFYVRDSHTGREGVVNNREFLNTHQEKQMAFQPDMILQFAHFLHDYYQKQGLKTPQVRAEVYVTMNARPSCLLIDPHRNLVEIEENWKAKDWLLPPAWEK
ncbi:MAG: HTTM domain-containing protein [Microscillaceae bacterium]